MFVFKDLVWYETNVLNVGYKRLEITPSLSKDYYLDVSSDSDHTPRLLTKISSENFDSMIRFSEGRVE